MPYAWDLPAVREKKIMLTINDSRRIVDIMEIGVLVPFKFHVTNSPEVQVLANVSLGPPKDPSCFLGCSSRWTPTDTAHHAIHC